MKTEKSMKYITNITNKLWNWVKFSVFTFPLSVLVLFSCSQEEFLPQDTTSLQILVSDFPAFSENHDTRAIGTQDVGKTEWEDGDQIIVTLTSKKFGAQNAVLTYDGTTWSTDARFLYLDNETPTVSVIYAPCYEVTEEGTMQLRNGIQLGMTEYLSGDSKVEDGIMTITFNSAKRDYSRLRFVASPGAELEVKISGEYTPAGGVESYNSDFTLTADQKGNAYLYGFFAEGTNIVVNRDNELPVEKQMPFNTVAGKSYALDARSYFYIDVNGWQLNKMFKTEKANCRTIKFVPSSSDFTPSFSDLYGNYAGFVTNGDTLEFHTNADGFVAPDDCSDMFSALSSLTTVDFGGCFDTSNVTNMENMFSDCGSLTSLDLSGFDTSKVTNMESMFFGCQNLATLDVSGFDTSKVTNMLAMFDSCVYLTSLDLSGFDTSKVTNMDSMFFGCGSLASLDVSGFDTSNVTNMNYMFYSCGSLTSLDLSGFDTSKVTNMDSMFFGCESLASLDLSGFNTSNVTNMENMFYSCSSLTSLDVSGFDTSNVTYMACMFSHCSKLVSLDLSGFDTSKVTDMIEMFDNCYNLTSLDLSGFDTSKVTDMRYMFDSCRCLQSLDVSNFNTSQVSSMNYMFQECRALAELDLQSFTFSHSPTVKSMFNGIGSSLDLMEIPVCVSAEGKTYLDGQNYTNTKAKFVLP